MAIRAYGNQIGSWVGLATMLLSTQGVNVVDVDEPFAELTVNGPKIASAYQTRMSVDRQTRRTQHWIALMNREKPEHLCAL
jgi:hypothetical protein